MISDFKDAFDDLSDCDLPTIEGSQVSDAMEQIKLLANRERFTWERLLPPTLAEAVALITDVDPSDPLTATVLLLCSLSGVLKLGTRVGTGAGYDVPANLYVGAIGPSGLSKSALLKKLIRHPRKDVDAWLKDLHDNRLSAWADACAALERGEEKPPKPLRILSMVNDYTSEALTRQLEAHEAEQAPLLIFRDELSGLLLAIEADEKRGRGGSQSQLLEVYDGEGTDKITVGSALNRFDACHLSVVGGIQPDKLKALIKGEDSQGQFARFLMLRIPLVPLKLPERATTLEEKAAMTAAKKLLRGTFNEFFQLAPKTYELSGEAMLRHRAWFTPKQEEALRTRHGVIESMLGKTGGQALRLAGLLHLVHTKGRTTTIPLETMELAIDIVEQLTHETRRFHLPTADEAQDILRIIHNQSWNGGKPTLLSTQDVKDKNSPLRGLKAPDFKQMVEALVASNLGTKVEGRRGSVKYLASRAMPS